MRLVSLFLLALSVALPATASAKPAGDAAPVLKKVGEHELLTERQGAAVAVQGGLIYVFGGANESGPLSDAERYDPRTNSCVRIHDQLIPRRYHRALEAGGRIYLFGGAGNGTRTQPFEPAVEIYDPVAKTVTRGASMEVARAHFAAGRIGNKFILAGGAKRQEGVGIVQTNETTIYDPQTNTWAAGVPMPTPRESQGAVAGSMFVVPGGFRGSSARKEVEFFVPQENAWKTLPALSRTISAHSVALLDKYLFLFGDYAALDLVLAYDLTTRQTHTLRVDFKGARHTAAAVLDGRIYVIGGNATTDGPPSKLIQVFTLQK